MGRQAHAETLSESGVGAHVQGVPASNLSALHEVVLHPLGTDHVGRLIGALQKVLWVVDGVLLSHRHPQSAISTTQHLQESHCHTILNSYTTLSHTILNPYITFHSQYHSHNNIKHPQLHHNIHLHCHSHTYIYMPYIHPQPLHNNVSHIILNPYTTFTYIVTDIPSSTPTQHLLTLSQSYHPQPLHNIYLH